MSGADASYFVSAKHWYGAPFGVWRLDRNDNQHDDQRNESASDEWQRLPRSDTPFSTNDRAKPVFDTQRKRILFYGARDESPGAAKSLGGSVAGMREIGAKACKPCAYAMSHESCILLAR